jgi:hypothetical protein
VVKKGGHLYHQIYQIDYPAKRLRFHLVKDGILIRRGIRVIPKDIQLDDILSAIYNFRSGTYGPYRRHVYYKIRTFTESGFPTIIVQILDGLEEKRERRLLGVPKDGGYIVKVIVPPSEIIPSKKGNISLWLSEIALPSKGLLKDSLFFGDIVGELVRSPKGLRGT